MGAWARPTIADLYFAFRQAKSTLFFEKRGVGLTALAAYESQLERNLTALRRRMGRGCWFDELELGQVWVVPKRSRAPLGQEESVVSVGHAGPEPVKRSIDVQLRLSPHPDFAIAEILFLWRFGGLLEAQLSKAVLGYRLDLRNNRVQRDRRWLFEYWPKRYQQFRSEPLEAARANLSRGNATVILNADLANFYDTIDPSFLLSSSMLTTLPFADTSDEWSIQYRAATESLLGAYSRFRKIATARAGVPITLGVPIGALTSRLVANLALASMDQHISSREGVLCYRRYVDDIVVVAHASETRSLSSTLERFLPLAERSSETARLDVQALQRPGSAFEIQTRKVRAHYLSGVPGADFVEAVASDFEKVVSERRAFLDASVLVGDGVSHLVRASNTEGSPLRVLREADRARLERFALSTSLRSLERVSSLVDREEARRLVRTCLEKIGRVLDGEDNWVDDLDVSMRLLKLAICTEDWVSTTELLARMDRTWGTVEALRSAAGELFYKGEAVGATNSAPWVWLRNYLHERRLEAIISCLPINLPPAEIGERFPHRLVVRTQSVGITALGRRARKLAVADLRARDHEDDGVVEGRLDHAWLRSHLDHDADLSIRLRTIDAFISRCQELSDGPWVMPAARLFLCTRPPSYFDISRRWLYRVEETGFKSDVFDELLRVVNAVRGTRYRSVVGTVWNQSEISLGANQAPVVRSDSSFEPRVILGNLVVEDEAWTGAATKVSGAPFGTPLRSLKRLNGLVEVLDKAEHACEHRAHGLLVLPELSLPRGWFRSVANHVVKSGRLGLVAGLEYLHHRSRNYVANQVFAVLPGPFMSVVTWPWTKRLPAREEALQLASLPTPVSFRPLRKREKSKARTAIHSPWGTFSVLICSEMIEARRVADLLGRVDLVLCPAWNQDTSSYDHLIQSVGFQLHAVIAVANNGHYSDCRAWAPKTERWRRDLCRLVERDTNDVVYVDLPLASLRAFHGGIQQGGSKYTRLENALARGEYRRATEMVKKLREESPGEWRPLPPDWG